VLGLPHAGLGDDAKHRPDGFLIRQRLRHLAPPDALHRNVRVAHVPRSGADTRAPLDVRDALAELHDGPHGTVPGMVWVTHVLLPVGVVVALAAQADELCARADEGQIIANGDLPLSGRRQLSGD